MKALDDYLRLLQDDLTRGIATEHTHRPALKGLLESLAPGAIVTNEPRRIECGAPDFMVTRREATIGYVEAKDVGKNLDEVEKSEQLKRYLPALTNFVLTDYLEFRWYTDGARRLVTRLGHIGADGHISRDTDGRAAVASLLQAFLSHQAAGVGVPRDLAVRMAQITHMVHDLVVSALTREGETGSLHLQLEAFRHNLLPELTAEQFADMYSQTIAYGLFAARCADPTEREFTRRNAAYLLPRTNPFLRNLFNQIAGPDLDDRIAWLVDDLAQVLAQADMSAVLQVFGKRTATEDPVVHFYETFLKEYDPRVREMRGVYYTPTPVVSYIVRSIDRLLKENFGKPAGLADEETLILDPAVGTGTFPYMVIEEIRQSLAARGQLGLWNQYVSDKLLPRIFGFELLMAPYAVAHLKLGLQLKETGYSFGTDQRLGIYLTNTLDEAVKRAESMFAHWITEESNAAADVKKQKPIMVVLGNPPYSGHSANKGEWARQLVARYKIIDGQPLGEKNPKWLQDDYVKFIAFGQWRIERTGQGILGFVTNHSYLDNPTFRGMRQSLLTSFTDIYILNIHGNSKRKERTPDGGKDENVFDIQQGVAIAVLVKRPGATGPAIVHYEDLWGLRDTKYRYLAKGSVASTQWTDVYPSGPSYVFVPSRGDSVSEYEDWWKVTDVFPVNSVGIVTARDGLTIHWTRGDIDDVIHGFSRLSVDEARATYGLGYDTRDWQVELAQRDLRESGLSAERIVPILYRPFDTRYTYFTGHSRGFHCMPRGDVMHHMLEQAGKNLGLVSARSNKSADMDHFFCSRTITETKCGESTTQSCLLPLYLYGAEGEMRFGDSGRRTNLNPIFTTRLSQSLGLRFFEQESGDLQNTLGPEDVFCYIYAVLHSPMYRERYAEVLRQDFARVPICSNSDLFEALVEKGAELTALHLMESPLLANLITKYPVSGTNIVEKVSYVEATQRVFINATQYFEGVPPEVWAFHIGGYQVAQKWLKDRKGRTLTYDDLIQYQRIIVALKETIRVMREIDEVIERYGGWPDAFQIVDTAEPAA
jgi:predicted helicase